MLIKKIGLRLFLPVEWERSRVDALICGINLLSLSNKLANQQTKVQTKLSTKFQKEKKVLLFDRVND
jgi:hypothetical protein